jgi:hypothetical protein
MDMKRLVTGLELVGFDLESGLRGRRRAGLALVASLPLMLLLSSCGSDETPDAADTAPPTETPAQAAPPTSPPAVHPDDVGAEIVSGRLPDGYPSDLPQPPSAEPGRALLIPGKGGLITFQSTEPPQAVVDHFKKALPEQGWNVETAADEPMRSVIKATKDSRSVNVIVNGSPGGSEIAITIEGA